jgi:TolB-like protein
MRIFASLFLFSLLFSTSLWAQNSPLGATSNEASNNTPDASKRNVAVLDFEGSLKDFTREELMAITNRFETEMMKAGVYQVLERRNMDYILQEQGFQQTGACNTSECQVEIGQLLGVELIVNGSVSKVGDVISLNLKMVDVGSGKNQMSHALDIRGDMQSVLRGGCYEMAQIFSGKKQPTDSHTVLAEESALWPWIVGGVAVLTGGVLTAVVLSGGGSEDLSKESVITQ